LALKLQSAVTWLCFTWDSEGIITASKDGSIRVWNINVRYHMDEDPKCLKVFSIPLQDGKGSAAHYDRLAVSPNNQVLAATHGSTLQWLRAETGEVLDTAENAHDGEITCLTWSPQPLPTEHGKATILATAGVDKKVKLWYPPSL
jgi:WD40 repeat protein